MHLKENKCHEKNGSSGNVKVSFSLTYYCVVITEKNILLCSIFGQESGSALHI
jgi:hypothetical protein